MLPAAARLVVELFESTPHVMVCVKDADGVYLGVNQMFARRAGCRSAHHVVGRTAADFFPDDLVSEYRAQDAALLQTGRATRNRLELVTDGEGRREWFLTSRMLHTEVSDATRSAPDDAVGVIVAVSTPAHLPSRSSGAGAGLRAAIDLVASHTEGRLDVEDLATCADMTVDQLERAMQRVLSVSPKQYLMRARLERAATLLATTDMSISDVAVRCGYYDQSQLTKYFRTSIGLTPNEYRRSSQTRAPRPADPTAPDITDR